MGKKRPILALRNYAMPPIQYTACFMCLTLKSEVPDILPKFELFFRFTNFSWCIPFHFSSIFYCFHVFISLASNVYLEN